MFNIRKFRLCSLTLHNKNLQNNVHMIPLLLYGSSHRIACFDGSFQTIASSTYVGQQFCFVFLQFCSVKLLVAEFIRIAEFWEFPTNSRYIKQQSTWMLLIRFQNIFRMYNLNKNAPCGFST